MPDSDVVVLTEDGMECSAGENILFNLFPVLCYSISSFNFIALIIIHVKIRKTFHPFFAILFGLTLLAYAICAVCAVLYRVLYLLEETVLLFYVSYLLDLSYGYISPMMLCCLVERAVATLLATRYEKARPWPLLALTQPFSIAVAVFNAFAGIGAFVDSDNADSILLFCQSMVILMCLIGLLALNRNLTKQQMFGSPHLTRKYQLAENIRVIRALLPVVLLDSAVTVTDALFTFFFHLDYIFYVTECYKPNYEILFFLRILFAAALEISIPISVILNHAAYRRVVCHVLKRAMRQSDKILPEPRKQSPIVRSSISISVVNVLGENVNPRLSNADYFASLQSFWNRASSI